MYFIQSYKLAICFPRLYVSPQFLTKLYQKASAKQLDGQYTDDERKIHGMAFGTVVAFIEESLNNADEEIPVFKMSDLVKMYVDNLEKIAFRNKSA